MFMINRWELYLDYSGKPLPQKGTFFRLEVYTRVGVSRVEIYEGVIEKLPYYYLKDFPNMSNG